MMNMRIKAVAAVLEALAPLHLQESYDNSGLLVGSPDQSVEKALLSLDCTEAVLDEAIAQGCQMVISHHPILFSGIKRLNGSNYVERVIMKAIKHDIALYAIHTNLDNVSHGVNQKICERLGLQNVRILSPKKELLNKLVVFCPESHEEALRTAIFEAGAGHIGNYDCCSFNVAGKGTFRGGEGSDPFVGQKGELHAEAEVRIETIFPSFLEGRIVNAMKTAHPYEEVAYDVYSLKNQWDQVGSGMIGELSEPMETKAFLEGLKKQMNCASVRYTQPTQEMVKRIAVCGGSGSFLLGKAMAAGADVFVTADYKYHQFFDADEQIVIADIGHFESEQFTAELIQEILREKIPNFATYLSQVNTNPINYL